MAEEYVLTYCVKCKQKTEWCEPPTLTRTRNNLNGFRGICKICNKTKFTFVSNVYMLNRNRKSSTSTSCPEPPKTGCT